MADRNDVCQLPQLPERRPDEPNIGRSAEAIQKRKTISQNPGAERAQQNVFQRSLIRALVAAQEAGQNVEAERDRKSTRLNSSHTVISYAVFCLKKKTQTETKTKQ